MLDMQVLEANLGIYRIFLDSLMDIQRTILREEVLKEILLNKRVKVIDHNVKSAPSLDILLLLVSSYEIYSMARIIIQALLLVLSMLG